MQRPGAAVRVATTHHSPHHDFHTYFWAVDRAGVPHDYGNKRVRAWPVFAGKVPLSV